MTIQDPSTSNFWRERLLSEEELVETLDAIKAKQLAWEARLRANDAVIVAFKQAMVKDFGYRKDSAEYKYVDNRIKPMGGRYGPRPSESDVRFAQGDLKTKLAGAEAKAKQKQDRLARYLASAKELGIDPLAYFGYEKGLADAVKRAKVDWLKEALVEAPYYVLASFYGHCLQSDWSDGTDSYGYDQLRSLDIPDDPRHPELNALAYEITAIAREWDGEDGRDFRGTYSALDALLNEEDSKTLGRMSDYYAEIYFGL